MIVLVIILVGCEVQTNKKLNSESAIENHSGSKKTISRKEGNLIFYEFESYFDNGIVEERYNMMDSVLHGKYYKFYPSGNLKSEESYVQGKSHGIKTVYEDTEKNIPESSITYINGEWKLRNVFTKKQDTLWQKHYFIREGTALLLAMNTYDKNGLLIQGSTQNDVSNYCEVNSFTDTVSITGTYEMKVLVHRHCNNSLIKLSASCDNFKNITLEDELLLADTSMMQSAFPEKNEILIKIKPCNLGHNLIVGKIYEFCHDEKFSDVERVMFFSKEFYVE